MVLSCTDEQVFSGLESRASDGGESCDCHRQVYTDCIDTCLLVQSSPYVGRMGQS